MSEFFLKILVMKFLGNCRVWQNLQCFLEMNSVVGRGLGLLVVEIQFVFILYQFILGFSEKVILIIFCFVRNIYDKWQMLEKGGKVIVFYFF